MTSCKNGLKNRALLRNISDLAPVLNNETRWTSTHNMLKRYNRIREKLISVAKEPDSTFILNRSTSFKSDAEMFGKHFEEINVFSTACRSSSLVFGKLSLCCMSSAMLSTVVGTISHLLSISVLWETPGFLRRLRSSILWILKMGWPKFSAVYQTD